MIWSSCAQFFLPFAPAANHAIRFFYEKQLAEKSANLLDKGFADYATKLKDQARSTRIAVAGIRDARIAADRLDGGDYSTYRYFVHQDPEFFGLGQAQSQ